jgi:hypothetical protein
MAHCLQRARSCAIRRRQLTKTAYGDCGPRVVRLFPTVRSAIPARRLLAIVPVVLLLTLAANSALAGAASIPAADPSRLGSQPVGEINDVILPDGPGEARAAAWSPPPGASGRRYQAGGMSIPIYVSPSYVPNESLSQSWADFFAQLPQDNDAGAMTVYFATPSEMTAICSEDAVACYAPSANLMILTGTGKASDGTPMEEIAAHEFAHHIANRRSNDPWEALDWGPKRWASLAGICPGVLNDEFFPGDPDNYDNDPGEGWAESYRVAAGGNESEWAIVSNDFFPDAEERNAALRDARDPWIGDRTRTWSGRFSRGRSRLKRIRVATPLDGRFNLRLRSSRGLDIDIYVLDEEQEAIVGRGRRSGRSESVNTLVCGDNDYYVYLQRASRRTGTYRLTLTWPG